MSSTSSRPQVVVVLSGWPRVSEVFALQEVRALHRAGMLAGVVATKRQPDGVLHPHARALDELVEVLPDADADTQAWDLVARLAGTGVDAIHGYFAHRPSAVAYLAAERLGVRFGFSAHAVDARRAAGRGLRERAGAAAVVVCCNDHTARVVRRAGCETVVVPHGVDLARFRRVEAHHDAGRVRLLAVGRLVEKKGFDVLLDAVADLPSRWSLDIVGAGPLHADLERRSRDLGLSDRLRFLGAVNHDELPHHYAAADIVVVPSVTDATGDRDGLPNVVLEAMAAGRPVVASRIAAIPSAVVHGQTGLLVGPGDASGLGSAITELALDPGKRRKFGDEGRARAESSFDLEQRTDEFCRTLAVAYA